jgi:hypothetical protein
LFDNYESASIFVKERQQKAKEFYENRFLKVIGQMN